MATRRTKRKGKDTKARSSPAVDVEFIAKPKIGRPSKFQPEFTEQARKLCALGHTDKEIAVFFEISEKTLYNWAAAHPEFLQSLKLGKEAVDDRVERSLFHRATGYSHEAVKIFADPKTGSEKIVKFIEHYPPDTTACIFWLKNRRPEAWRDRVERVVSLDGKARVEKAVELWIQECKHRGIENPTREEALRYLAPEMPEIRELGRIGGFSPDGEVKPARQNQRGRGT